MNVLLFGASGSAGGAVLSACLATPVVREVRAIVRRPLAITNQKLRTVVHSDFLNYSAIAEAFDSVDACLFCLGVSITRASKDEYRKITHDFTLAAAHMLQMRSPHAAFHYISGQGTSPGSRMFWSRVKAQTEMELIDVIGADCWRPAFIDAQPSANLPKTIAAVVYPALRLLKPFRWLYVAGKDLGYAMLEATREKVRGRIFENPEIRDLAARFRGR
ncbi:MAG TPA: NAD(P)H-binding protein [Candidatus Acidoferrum sp.]